MKSPRSFFLLPLLAFLPAGAFPALLLAAFACGPGAIADTPQVPAIAAAPVDTSPEWDKVTWETRYDNAKLAHLRLNVKSTIPGQLAAINKVDAVFKPSQGPEVILAGGWEHGYVFDNWEQLVKQLETLVDGISIKQAPFNPGNSHWQLFALTPGQQKQLRRQTGAISLKISCEFYQLKLKAKIPLNAPASIKNGLDLIQFAPTDDTAELEVSRTGTIDPSDKRASRALVFLLVDPDNHTATLLQETAANGFFNPGRDPARLDLLYHLGVVPDKTPLDHKILYLFDPVLCGAGETTASNPNFNMQWP